jgi:hypothetical protein
MFEVFFYTWITRKHQYVINIDDDEIVESIENLPHDPHKLARRIFQSKRHAFELVNAFLRNDSTLPASIR